MIEFPMWMLMVIAAVVIASMGQVWWLWKKEAAGERWEEAGPAEREEATSRKVARATVCAAALMVLGWVVTGLLGTVWAGIAATTLAVQAWVLRSEWKHWKQQRTRAQVVKKVGMVMGALLVYPATELLGNTVAEGAGAGEASVAAIQSWMTGIGGAYLIACLVVYRIERNANKAMLA